MQCRLLKCDGIFCKAMAYIRDRMLSSTSANYPCVLMVYTAVADCPFWLLIFSRNTNDDEQ